jgi:hypothetical protein
MHGERAVYRHTVSLSCGYRAEGIQRGAAYQREQVEEEVGILAQDVEQIAAHRLENLSEEGLRAP